MCVSKQKDWVLRWCNPMPSLWDVVSRWPCGLWSHNGRYKNSFQIFNFYGIPIHTNVFRNVGLWHTWWFVLWKGSEWIPSRSFYQVEGNSFSKFFSHNFIFNTKKNSKIAKCTCLVCLLCLCFFYLKITWTLSVLSQGAVACW